MLRISNYHRASVLLYITLRFRSLHFGCNVHSLHFNLLTCLRLGSLTSCSVKLLGNTACLLTTQQHDVLAQCSVTSQSGTCQVFDMSFMFSTAALLNGDISKCQVSSSVGYNKESKLAYTVFLDLTARHIPTATRQHATQQFATCHHAARQHATQQFDACHHAARQHAACLYDDALPPRTATHCLLTRQLLTRQLAAHTATLPTHTATRCMLERHLAVDTASTRSRSMHDIIALAISTI
jgi:hypothetical protein